MWKPVMYGAVAAIVLVSLTLLGGYLYLGRSGELSKAEAPENVVLIFESPAEDGATVAGLITVVSGGRMKDISPETTVTIPGTSYSRLRDSFAFGGGAAVVAALGPSALPAGTGFVSVPEKIWRAAVDATGGVQVSVRSEMTVFTGTEIVTVRAGVQRLRGAQVSAVVRGLPYLTVSESALLRRELEEKLSLALITSQPTVDNFGTDLAEKPLARWLMSDLPQAANSVVE